MAKNRVCERMIRKVGKHLTFRVWVTADQDFYVDTTKIEQTLESITTLQYSKEDLNEAISAIEKLDNIAAFEILNTLGNGILLYPDWN